MSIFSSLRMLGPFQHEKPDTIGSVSYPTMGFNSEIFDGR